MLKLSISHLLSSQNNRTALMKAADKGHAPVVAHLIQKGADVAHKDNV